MDTQSGPCSQLQLGFQSSLYMGLVNRFLWVFLITPSGVCKKKTPRGAKWWLSFSCEFQGFLLTFLPTFCPDSRFQKLRKNLVAWPFCPEKEVPSPVQADRRGEWKEYDPDSALEPSKLGFWADGWMGQKVRFKFQGLFFGFCETKNYFIIFLEEVASGFCQFFRSNKFPIFWKEMASAGNGDLCGHNFYSIRLCNSTPFPLRTSFLNGFTMPFCPVFCSLAKLGGLFRENVPQACHPWPLRLCWLKPISASEIFNHGPNSNIFRKERKAKH